jgi:hypothetical protein
MNPHFSRNVYIMEWGTVWNEDFFQMSGNLIYLCLKSCEFIRQEMLSNGRGVWSVTNNQLFSVADPLKKKCFCFIILMGCQSNRLWLLILLLFSWHKTKCLIAVPLWSGWSWEGLATKNITENDVDQCVGNRSVYRPASPFLITRVLNLIRKKSPFFCYPFMRCFYS